MEDDQTDLLVKRLAQATHFPYPHQCVARTLDGRPCIIIELRPHEYSVEAERELDARVRKLCDAMQPLRKMGWLWNRPIECEDSQQRPIGSTPTRLVFSGKNQAELEKLVARVEKRHANTLRQFFAEHFLQKDPWGMILGGSETADKALNTASAALDKPSTLREVSAAAASMPGDGPRVAAMIDAVWGRKTAESYLGELLAQEKSGTPEERETASQVLTDFAKYVPLFAPYIAQRRAQKGSVATDEKEDADSLGEPVPTVGPYAPLVGIFPLVPKTQVAGKAASTGAVAARPVDPSQDRNR